jgi:two-component system response regulator YesN
MYKLLIVDDEPLVQVGIKSMLDWDARNIEIIGTASNGDAALKMIEADMPDIVITDIKMPIRSGLDLLRICRERYGSLPAFLILTSYEDFAMAKQAISYQVTDYLVKLELDADMLDASIQKAIALVDENRAPAPAEASFFSTALLQERFFIRLVNNLFESEEEFLLQKEELSLSFSPSGTLAAYCRMTTPAANTADTDRLLELSGSALQMFRQLIQKYVDCYVTPLDIRHFLILFPLPHGAEDWRETLQKALSDTCTMLKNYYNVTVCTGLGHPVKNPYDLPGSFSAAKYALSEAGEDRTFLFFDQVQDQSGARNVFNLAIFKDDIRTAYEEMDHERLQQIFASITELFAQHASHYPQAMDAAGSILYLTLSLLSGGEEIVSGIFSGEPEGYRSLYQLTTTEQVIGWMQTLCDGLCEYFVREKDSYKNHVVANVKAYINQNLGQKLTLNEVAAAFGISPAYLSSLFGKYSDLGFVTYVNHAKVNAAKEMLRDSNDKVYEVAEKLGFESAFYFSKVFKKIEGCSPREYVQHL